MSWKMTVIGGLAALGLSLVTVPMTTTSAEAQVSYGHYPRGIPAYGGGYRPSGGFYRGGGYRGGYYRGGYRGAYYGRPYRHGYYGYRRGDRGAAVAAGVIGGLALGALATAPAYGYGYGYQPAYYGPRYAAPYSRCWTERRVRYNRWGERIVRRVRVCG